MARTDYATRLRIPIEGQADTPFYTKDGHPIALGYERIVIGARGPYIEFTDAQILTENLIIPEEYAWRMGVDYVFYDEWRSPDRTVKVYHQRKTVDYADYIVGRWYVSPFDVITKTIQELVEPLARSAK